MKKKNWFFKILEGIWLFIRYGPAKVSEWRNQSIYDNLTGLYNRRFLQEIGKIELAKARRSERQKVSYPISIILIDIDHFKVINDEEGHLNGDKVLQNVATLLKRICQRETDIVSRIGGDEFLILLPQTTKEAAQAIIDRLEKLAEKELVSPKGRPIGLSCGLAEDFSPEALKRADVDMYKEKRSKV